MEAIVGGGFKASPGSNGTGGLLIIYGNAIENNGTVSSNGMSGGKGEAAGGGGSGGGSVNIFFSTNINRGTVTATGGSGGIGERYRTGGNGGDGCVSIGSVVEGTYVPYAY